MIRSLQRVEGWLQDAARGAALRGAHMAVRVPALRPYLLRGLLAELERAYTDEVGDRVQLLHDRWFARHLQKFLYRLLDERPAAARANLRFLDTWSRDVRRRSAAQALGRITPATVVIEPTDRCNLGCPGCYAKSTRDGADLSYEQLVGIVEEVIGMGVTLVTLSGGEPFLREREDQVITRLAEKFPDHGFLVYTNGTLIDEAMAQRLGEVGNVFPADKVFPSRTVAPGSSWRSAAS
jgi:uncharacterized radical SAM superfamily Fe-S cluster-containing enzyme